MTVVATPAEWTVADRVPARRERLTRMAVGARHAGVGGVEREARRAVVEGRQFPDARVMTARAVVAPGARELAGVRVRVAVGAVAAACPGRGPPDGIGRELLRVARRTPRARVGAVERPIRPEAVVEGAGRRRAEGASVVTARAPGATVDSIRQRGPREQSVVRIGVTGHTALHIAGEVLCDLAEAACVVASAMTGCTVRLSVRSRQREAGPGAVVEARWMQRLERVDGVTACAGGAVFDGRGQGRVGEGAGMDIGVAPGTGRRVAGMKFVDAAEPAPVPIRNRARCVARCTVVEGVPLLEGEAGPGRVIEGTVRAAEIVRVVAVRTSCRLATRRQGREGAVVDIGVARFTGARQPAEHPRRFGMGGEGIRIVRAGHKGVVAGVALQCGVQTRQRKAGVGVCGQPEAMRREGVARVARQAIAPSVLTVGELTVMGILVAFRTGVRGTSRVGVSEGVARAARMTVGAGQSVVRGLQREAARSVPRVLEADLTARPSRMTLAVAHGACIRGWTRGAVGPG